MAARESSSKVHAKHKTYTHLTQLTAEGQLPVDFLLVKKVTLDTNGY